MEDRVDVAIQVFKACLALVLLLYDYYFYGYFSCPKEEYLEACCFSHNYYNRVQDPPAESFNVNFMAHSKLYLFFTEK